MEICNNDVWGTVCDDSWTSVDAGVVCIQLGLPSSGTLCIIVSRHYCCHPLACTLGAVALQGSETMDGTGQIWLNSVSCTNFMTRITDCTLSTFGGHSCSHSEDVGVICQGKKIELTQRIFKFSSMCRKVPLAQREISDF